MNGIHDLGGMAGFGPVIREDNEPVFHSGWEGRMFALATSVLAAAGVSADEFRHAIERIPPAAYLASSYYERWLAAVETLAVERGIVSRGELIARLSAAGIDPAQIARPAQGNALATAQEKSSAQPRRARFRIGDRVRARNLNPAGHTRLPRYARGKAGVIARDWGGFVFPDTNAHHAGGRPQHCYSVAFAARELWGKSAPARQRVYVDLWEDYLEPATPKAQAKKPRRAARRSHERRTS